MSLTLSSFWIFALSISDPSFCFVAFFPATTRGKRFALIGYFGRMRGGLVGGHRTGVREDGGGGGGHELRPRPSVLSQGDKLRRHSEPIVTCILNERLGRFLSKSCGSNYEKRG